jgi:hypothetical protein
MQKFARVATRQAKTMDPTSDHIYYPSDLSHAAPHEEDQLAQYSAQYGVQNIGADSGQYAYPQSSYSLPPPFESSNSGTRSQLTADASYAPHNPSIIHPGHPAPPLHAHATSLTGSGVPPTPGLHIRLPPVQLATELAPGAALNGRKRGLSLSTADNVASTVPAEGVAKRPRRARADPEEKARAAVVEKAAKATRKEEKKAVSPAVFILRPPHLKLRADMTTHS